MRQTEERKALQDTGRQENKFSSYVTVTRGEWVLSIHSYSDGVLDAFSWILHLKGTCLICDWLLLNVLAFQQLMRSCDTLSQINTSIQKLIFSPIIAFTPLPPKFYICFKLRVWEYSIHCLLQNNYFKHVLWDNPVWRTIF